MVVLIDIETEQFQIVKKFLIAKISELKKISTEDLIRLRNEKFLNIA